MNYRLELSIWIVVVSPAKLCDYFLHSGQFDSHYATADQSQPKHNSSRTNSLPVIIENLRKRVESKTWLRAFDLQIVLNKLKTQPANAEQAFEILNCCANARYDGTQDNAVEQIWNHLKGQHENFSIQHYNCMLSFAKKRGNIKLAEEIFNEIESKEIKPDV